MVPGRNSDEHGREPGFIQDLKSHPQRPPPPSRALRRKQPVDPVRQALLRSLTLHLFVVALALAAYVKQRYFPSGEAEALLKAKEFHSAIRVDIVDLPRLRAQDLSKVDLTKEKTADKPKEAAPPAPPPPSETAMVLKDEKSEKPKHQSAKDRIKELRERISADARRRELMKKYGKKGDDESEDAREKLAGNIVSEGYSVTGDVASDLDVYQGKIQAHLRNHWKVPAWITASNLHARVLVKLAPDGRIVSKSFLAKSGNGDFDAYVERTFVDANPLPAPPQALTRIVLEDGIECGFPK